MNKIVQWLFVLLILNSGNVLAQKNYRHQTNDPDFLKAWELYQNNKLGAARLAFEAYAKKNVQDESNYNVEAVFYAARCAQQLGNGDALYLYEQFLADYPESNKNPYAQFHGGEILQESKKFKQAVRWYEKVNYQNLDSETQNAYYFKRGYSLFMDDNLNDASTWFMKLKDVESEYYQPSNYYYAHIQYTKKNYETALKSFLKLQQDEAYSKIVPFYIAQIYYLQKEYDKAIDFATPLMNEGTEARQADMARVIGSSWFAKKEYAKAVPHLEKAIANPDFARKEDYYQLGFAYYYQKNYAKAAESFSKVTSENNDMAQNAYYHLGDCYLKLNDKMRARVAFEAASKLSFDKNIQEDAMLNYLKLNYELAYSPFNEIINSFLKFIELFPNSANIDQAYEYLGKAFLTTKNYKEALQSMEKIKRKDSNVYRAMQRIAYYRGIELFTSLNFVESVGFFTQSLKYGEYDKDLKVKALYWRGEANYRLGKNSEAGKDYNEFILTSGSFKLPEFKTAHYNLGYVSFNDKNYQEAGSWFRKYIKLTENDKAGTLTGDACNRIGDCFYVDRAFSAAISYYEKSIVIPTGAPDYALYQKAFCLGLLKQHNEKIAILKQLVRQYPSSPYVDDALYESGSSYVALNDYPNAIASFKQVKEKYPQSSLAKRALLQLGLVYYNNSDYDNSMAFYKRVVNEYPGSPESQNALLGIRNIYMDKSQPDNYIQYTETLGAFARTDIRSQDSLTFESAQRFFIKEDCEHAIKHFENYLTTFPEGRYAVDAHYNKATCQYKAGLLRDAVKSFEYVANRPRNMYTEDALLKCGEIYFQDNTFDKALLNFRRLTEIAEVEENRMEARIGVLRCLVKTNQFSDVILAAQSLLQSPKLAPEIEREARFARAKAYEKTGNLPLAVTDFKALSTNTKSVEGAESKYLLAQYYFNSGNDASAEKEIFDFAEKGTAHQYWLARSFILLSDIYLKKGDNFQAKQYLESIMENYTGIDDVKPMAQERLKKIASNKPAAAASETLPL